MILYDFVEFHAAHRFGSNRMHPAAPPCEINEIIGFAGGALQGALRAGGVLFSDAVRERTLTPRRRPRAPPSEINVIHWIH